MANYAYRDAPPQWRNLLVEHPQFAGADPAKVELDQERHSQLATVQKDVRDRFPYRRDIELHGQTDIWLPAAEGVGGDCEDLALRMWLQLVEWGWDPGCLSLALCRGAAGYHAVLLVHSTEGFIVLDHLMWMPAGLPDLTHDGSMLGGYVWLRRSQPGEERWVEMWVGKGLAEARELNPAIRELNSTWLRRLTA